MTRVNHDSDVLKLIDDRAKARAELDAIVRENARGSDAGRQHREKEVFSVWPELGIFSDFHSRKQRLVRLDVSLASHFVQELDKAVREHVRELTRYEQILKKAEDINQTNGIPTQVVGMETAQQTFFAFRDFFFELLTSRLAGQEPRTMDRAAIQGMNEIIGLFPSLQDRAKAAIAHLESALEQGFDGGNNLSSPAPNE